MKTDIAGSTATFRSLLAADLQALLSEHRAVVECHAAEEGGRIVKPAGDGYWLEFPSVTSAARSAIAMQDGLRFTQSNRGDDRLSMRVVIGLGDVGVQGCDLFGDTLALIARIEAITPADAIYLTAAARLAITSAEIQTALVDSFSLKGFAEPVLVYRVEQRHRTRIITDAYVLISDLCGFTRFIENSPVTAIEQLLDTLDALITGVTHEFGGTIRFNAGDAYCVTFPEVLQVMAAAERLSQQWKASNHQECTNCPINIAVSRGNINAFRSFFYGPGIDVAMQVEEASRQVVANGEGGVFVTGAVRDDLSRSQWHNRLQYVALKLRAPPAGLEVYRLGSPPSP
jgi:class 3 adenylate cyclase